MRDAGQSEALRDARYLDEVLSGIVDRLGTEDYARYTPDERVVLLVRVCVQVVENGGLAFLFERPMPCDDDYTQTLDALDLVGAVAAAEVLREALAQFPHGRPAFDLLVRSEQYDQVPQVRRDQLDDAFLASVPQISRSLVRFIRARRLGTPE